MKTYKNTQKKMVACVAAAVIVLSGFALMLSRSDVEAEKSSMSEKAEEKVSIDKENAEEFGYVCQCHHTNGIVDNEFVSDNNEHLFVVCSEDCAWAELLRAQYQANDITSIDSFNGNVTLSNITVEGDFHFELGQNENKQQNSATYFIVVGDYNTVAESIGKGWHKAEGQEKTISKITDENIAEVAGGNTQLESSMKASVSASASAKASSTIKETKTTNKYYFIESQPDSKPDSQPDSQLDSKPDSQPDSQPDSEPDSQPDSEPDSQPDSQPDSEPDSQPDSQPDSEPDSQPDSDDGFDEVEPCNPPKIAWEYDSATGCLYFSVYLRSETDEFELVFMDGSEEFGGYFLSAETAEDGLGKTFKCTVENPKEVYIICTNANGETTNYAYSAGNFQ